jgi:hypothetical protein
MVKEVPRKQVRINQNAGEAATRSGARVLSAKADYVNKLHSASEYAKRFSEQDLKSH